MSAGTIIDEGGNFICISCRKTKQFSESETCAACDKFVCKSCAVYHRQFPYGYFCKKCHANSKKNK